MKLKFIKSPVRAELKKVRERISLLSTAYRRATRLWSMTRHNELSPYGRDAYVESVDKLVREFYSEQALQLFSNKRVLGMTTTVVKHSKCRIAKPLNLEELDEYQELTRLEAYLASKLESSAKQSKVS